MPNIIGKDFTVVLWSQKNMAFSQGLYENKIIT